MEVIVNGKKTSLAEGTALLALLTERGFSPSGIVVELNGEIIPSERFANVVLRAGDALELVRLVGGG